MLPLKVRAIAACRRAGGRPFRVENEFGAEGADRRSPGGESVFPFCG